jgi:hypothetical protein
VLCCAVDGEENVVRQRRLPARVRELNTPAQGTTWVEQWDRFQIAQALASQVGMVLKGTLHLGGMRRSLEVKDAGHEGWVPLRLTKADYWTGRGGEICDTPP